MAAPSEDWQGFAVLDSESERYRRIKLITSSANFEYLKQRAIDLRRNSQANLLPEVDCCINLTRFALGFDNLVMEIAFSDNVYWSARIPHRPIDDDFETLLLSEIGTTNTLRKHTSIPVSQVFEFKLTTEQPFGYPYVLMEYLGGRTLGDGLAVSVPPQHHGKVARELANVFVELQNLTFDRIGRLWCGETADQPAEIIAMA